MKLDTSTPEILKTKTQTLQMSIYHQPIDFSMFNKFSQEFSYESARKFYAKIEAEYERFNKKLQPSLKNPTDNEIFNRQPVYIRKSNQRYLVKILQILIDMSNSNCYTVEHKCEIVHRLYAWLAKNTWLLSKYSRLNETMKSKLKEFKTNAPEDARKIIEDFGWMMGADFSNPDVHHSDDKSSRRPVIVQLNE